MDIKNQNIAAIIGKFNPPTIGHLSLIQELQKYISTTFGEISPIIYVFIVESENNPGVLSGIDRIRMFKSMFNSSFLKFVIVKDVKHIISYIKKSNLYIKAISYGNDRNYAAIFKNAKTIVLKRSDTKIDNLVIKFNQNEKISLDEISSSLVREIVQQNDFNSFLELTGLNKDEPLSFKFFSKIKSNLELKDLGGKI